MCRALSAARRARFVRELAEIDIQAEAAASGQVKVTPESFIFAMETGVDPSKALPVVEYSAVHDLFHELAAIVALSEVKPSLLGKAVGREGVINRAQLVP